MTPYWLSRHAEISGSYSVRPDYLEIPTGGVIFGRLIRVQLAPPRNLSKEDDVTVTITVAMDTVYAHGVHHDPYFGIRALSALRHLVILTTPYIYHAFMLKQ